MQVFTEAPRDKQKEKERDERLLKWVKQQRTKIYFSAPGTFTMMGGLPIEVSDEIATFATDGRKILVNRDYARSISAKDCRGILIHEALHVANLHHTRNRNEQFCHELWNQATDYVINGWIKSSKNYGTEFTLPEGTLWDRTYSTKGWSAEKVAREMLRKGWEPSPQPPKPPIGTDGFPVPGDEDGDGPEDGEGPSVPSEDGDGPPPEDGGQGPVNHGPGEILPSPTIEEGEEEVEQEEQEIMERVQQAALTEKSMGEGAGGFCTKVTELDGKTTSGEELRYILNREFSAQRSLRRPNRRFIHQGIYLPGKIKSPHTLYATMDTSASVGLSEFQSYCKTVLRWSKELGLKRLRVAYVDTVIHKNPDTGEPWHDIDLETNQGAEVLDMKFPGGGGTSFDPIFNYLDKSRDDVGALVYFTDGYGDVTKRSTSYPVVWVTSGVHPTVYDMNGHIADGGFGIVLDIHK